MKTDLQTFKTTQTKEYLKLLIGAVLLVTYALLFTYFYVQNIYPRWGYFGFKLDPDNADSYWLGIFCICIAYLFVPRKASTASDYVLWLLFILAFVPIQITVGLSNPKNIGVFTNQVALVISFAISAVCARLFGRIVWIPLKKHPMHFERKAILSTGAFKRNFILFSMFVVALLVLRFRSIMNFAGIEEVYQQRAAASEFGIGALFGYLILWTTYLLSPLIIAMGLVTSKRYLVAIALFMLLIIYMITAAKITFVVIFFCLAVHALNRVDLRQNMYLLILLPVCPLFTALFVQFFWGGDVGAIISYVIDQLVVRGIAIQAMIFNLYMDFFSDNPFTYYSHVTGVSLLVEYPYDLPVGRVISQYQYGHPGVNANSGVWATDGVAAAGALGIVFVGLILGVFLGFANRMTRNVGHEFLSISMVPLAMLMVNVSMFTTLASGGGFLLVLLVRRLWKEIHQTHPFQLQRTQPVNG